MVTLSHWIFFVTCFYFCLCPALRWLSVICFWYFLWFIMIFKYFSSIFQSYGCPLRLGSSSANLMNLVDTSLPRSREHWCPGQWPLELVPPTPTPLPGSHWWLIFNLYLNTFPAITVCWVPFRGVTVLSVLHWNAVYQIYFLTSPQISSPHGATGNQITMYCFYSSYGLYSIIVHYVTLTSLFCPKVMLALLW